VQPHRYVEHYPPRRTDVAMAATMLALLCVVAAIPVFVGGTIAWVLGVVDLVLLGPVVAVLIAAVRHDIRHDRNDTILFSIDLEGVYDGRTGTMLPWSDVTAVKLIQPTKNEPPAGLVVLGVAAGEELALFHSTYAISRVRSAIQAFAPHVPIEYTTAKQVRHLHASRSRSS